MIFNLIYTSTVNAKVLVLVIEEQKPEAVQIALNVAPVRLPLAEELIRVPLVRLNDVAQLLLAARRDAPVVRQVARAPVHAVLAFAQVALALLELRLRERLLGLLAVGFAALFALAIALHESKQKTRLDSCKVLAYPETGF